jgi:hypothetical protein
MRGVKDFRGKKKVFKILHTTWSIRKLIVNLGMAKGKDRNELYITHTLNTQNWAFSSTVRLV